MAKGKRGLKFTIRNLQRLGKAVEELVPVSNTEWEQVWDMQKVFYPEQNETIESLKCKFQEMARPKNQNRRSEYAASHL
jgi:hypothetical protein